MARIRSMKPEFWSDTRMSRLPALTRLVFWCLVSMADDEGRIEGDAETVWRFGSFREDSREVASALATLRGLSRVVLYESEGNPYIAIVNFCKHQRIAHPTKSKLPAPSGGCDLLAGDFTNPHEDSRKFAPDLEQGAGSREQGKREGARQRRAPPPPAGKQDYPEIPDVVRRWAAERGFAPYLELHHAHFRDYLANRSGKPYADLDAAFRTCIRADWGAVRAAAARDGRINGKPPAPTFDPDRWWTADAGIAAQASKLGVERRVGENIVQFHARVLLAAGEGPWMETNNVTLRRVMTEIAEKAA